MINFSVVTGFKFSYFELLLICNLVINWFINNFAKVVWIFCFISIYLPPNNHHHTKHKFAYDLPLFGFDQHASSRQLDRQLSLSRLVATMCSSNRRGSFLPPIPLFPSRCVAFSVLRARDENSKFPFVLDPGSFHLPITTTHSKFIHLAWFGYYQRPGELITAMNLIYPVEERLIQFCLFLLPVPVRLKQGDKGDSIEGVHGWQFSGTNERGEFGWSSGCVSWIILFKCISQNHWLFFQFGIGNQIYHVHSFDGVMWGDETPGDWSGIPWP